jgi:hypothetical protein
VRDVMREAGVGEMVSYSDEVRAEARVPEIAAALARLIDRGRDPAPTPSPNLSGMRAYSAARATEHITSTFDAAVGQA